MYSMDALFGLPRKKAAEKSFRNPLHESQYVASHKAHQKIEADTSLTVRVITC